MCYELFHKCRFCNKTYDCSLENYMCPTINGDVNKNMCDDCAIKEAEDFRKWLEQGNELPKSIDEWENK